MVALTSAPARPRTHTDAIPLLESANAIRWSVMMMVIIMMNMTMMVMMAMVVMMVNGREQGWQGVNCSSRCSKSSWGEKCRETCDCEYGTCHPDNGKIHSIFIPDKLSSKELSTNIIFFLSILYPGNCICERGFTGRRCDMPCPQVTF